ncbi:hypothetical protein [Arcobacter sp. F2176]|uniref:hypothetical protein n=1 Tax=Arcobacter sp. F2176 TaxID=2044511 RepID=UPI00100A718F|nr:hypothetical protein [Arcobacter sp. F2176]RXJ79243.1 hypothetical protein CRU95_14660 [Arcobacter sp. F2176]
MTKISNEDKKIFLKMIKVKDLEELKKLNLTEPYYQYITILWEKDDIEGLEYLRNNQLINDNDIFLLTFMKVKDGRNYDFTSLLKMIKKYLQDAPLVIEDEIILKNLSRDSALEYVKDWISAGAVFDYEKLFDYSFLGSTTSHEFTNYLLDNFELSTELIKSVEYPAKVKYNKKDPLIQKLIKKGMAYEEPTLKKTKIIKEFELTKEESLDNISFINKTKVVLKIYNKEKKESRLDIFCLDTNNTINSLTIKDNSLVYCAWREGIAVLTLQGVTFMPLYENSNPIYYEMSNPDDLKHLTKDEFLRIPDYSNVIAINDDTLLVHLYTPAKKEGRALSILKIKKSTCQMLNIYKEINEPEIIDMLGINERSPSYIYLHECTYSHDKIWCIVEGSSINRQLRGEHPYTLLTSYHYSENMDLVSPSSKTNIFKKLLNSFSNSDEKEENQNNIFKWEKTKIKLEGAKSFFSDDGLYIWSLMKGKNKMFCQKITDTKFLYEIRITASQNLKEIPLNKVSVCMYDKQHFILYDFSRWNLCEVIN